MNHKFMFTVGMLAQLTGNNPQYLSKKVRRMIHDPNVNLQATLHSNKEGYRIPEDEVLRCFHNVTPEQIQQFKSNYSFHSPKPKARKLTGSPDPSQTQPTLAPENELLFNWMVYLAGTAPDQKNSPETRAFLEQEILKIQLLKEQKLKEYALLEQLIADCDAMIAKIRSRLDSPITP